MKDCVDDIVVKAETPFKSGKSWASDELKGSKVCLHTED
jgi:hypothetical protein